MCEKFTKIGSDAMSKELIKTKLQVKDNLVNVMRVRNIYIIFH